MDHNVVPTVIRDADTRLVTYSFVKGIDTNNSMLYLADETKFKAYYISNLVPIKRGYKKLYPLNFNKHTLSLFYFVTITLIVLLNFPASILHRYNPVASRGKRTE